MLFPRPLPATSGPLGTGVHAASEELECFSEDLGVRGLAVKDLHCPLGCRGEGVVQGLVAWIEMKDLEYSVPAPAL